MNLTIALRVNSFLGQNESLSKKTKSNEYIQVIPQNFKSDVFEANLKNNYSSNLSFGISKSAFDEYSLACVNRFKLPIEKWDGMENLNKWAKIRLRKITKVSQYLKENLIYDDLLQRNFSEWINYLENDDLYKNDPPLKLMIFDGITKELDPNSSALPPPLNKKVLRATVEQIKLKMEANPKLVPNFNKMYWDNLFLEYTKDLPSTGWIKIPAIEISYSSRDIPENAKKLRVLSHHNWCTKNDQATMKLLDGDFYIYFKEGKPQIGISHNILSNTFEIAGEDNNQRFPVKHLKEIKPLFKKMKWDKWYINNAKETKKELENIQKRFTKEIQEHNYKNVLEYLGYKPVVLDDGMLEIEYFEQPKNFALKDIGIDENELFKKIKGIRENALFEYSNATNLGNLKYINKDADLRHSKVKNLGELQTVKQDLFLSKEIPGKLASVGNLYVARHYIFDIPSILRNGNAA